MAVAGVDWGAHTKFQANRRSFDRWTRVLKKLRRFGGYQQNFISEWLSLWCSDWAEIFCEKFSRVEEHPLKYLRNSDTLFGRCFWTEGGSWARLARFVGIWHFRRGPLRDTGWLACAFSAKFCMVVAGVEWGAHTKFQANRRSFCRWTRVSKKLRRFGGYQQNFILEWLSMWCSNWAEIFCENISRVEEHPLKISRDLHARFGRCFWTGGGTWARLARFVGIWHQRRGLLWATGWLARVFGTFEADLFGTQGDWLVHFLRNFVWW